MAEGDVLFNRCNDTTKQQVVDSLLKQYGGGESGKTPESVKIHKHVSNALISLADHVILPEVESETGRREENKWPDLLRTTLVVAAGKFGF